MQMGRRTADSHKYWGGSEHYTAMHVASHYGYAQSMRMPLLQPGRTTDSFVTNGRVLS